MKTKVTEQLREEIRHFRLQFACEQCAYFDTNRELCSEGYPNRDHLLVSLLEPELLFCKLFESA
jgi:hypothetical protein